MERERLEARQALADYGSVRRALDDGQVTPEIIGYYCSDSPQLLTIGAYCIPYKRLKERIAVHFLDIWRHLIAT